MGIEYALSKSCSDQDYILMMNNDTEIPEDYVEILVAASRRFDAAVGALVVDSRDTNKVLDAGEYISWPDYTFPVKSEIYPGEIYCNDVDVLPGRGSIIPIKMIKKVGNVNSRTFPHYIADYEFFTRLKNNGYRLGVTYETRISAHIEETGIIPSQDLASFSEISKEVFSRRSMNNLFDHWNFISSHAPRQHRQVLLTKLIIRAFGHFVMRTWLRWPLRSVLLFLKAVRQIAHCNIAQYKMFKNFFKAYRVRRSDVFCDPKVIPGSIRPIIFRICCPGPINKKDCEETGVDLERLIASGVVMPMSSPGWYRFTTLQICGSNAQNLLNRAKSWQVKRQRIFQDKGLKQEILKG